MQVQADIVDIFLQLVIFATFVIFGVAMLLIKIQKGKKSKQDESEKKSVNTGD
jgi:hypothetical protein